MLPWVASFFLHYYNLCKCLINMIRPIIPIIQEAFGLTQTKTVLWARVDGRMCRHVPNRQMTACEARRRFEISLTGRQQWILQSRWQRFLAALESS